MAEGLKIVVGADVKEAERALKGFVGTAQKTGAQAGQALGKGLGAVPPVVKKIQTSAKPAQLAVSKLGDSIETLRALMLAKQQFLVTEKDITKVAILNKEIKALQGEILRVQAVGASGVNLGGVGTAATKGFSLLRQAAFVLPGVGVAGILGGITDGIASLFTAAEKAESKIKDLIKATSSIRIEAAAGTAGESAKVSALAAVVLDQTKAYEQRNRALNELKEINKNYFGDLTLEQSSLSKLTGLVNEYTNALIQQAVIKEFSDEIGKVSVAIAKQIPLIGNAAAELKKFQRRQQDVEKASPKFSGLAAQGNTDELNKAVSLVDKANSKLKEESGTLDQLTGQSRDLRKALADAVLESLKFKPLDDSGVKEKTDNIIAQAKRLAAFLDRNTQFEVKFEVDETISEEANKKSAREFIAKARSFIEKQTPEFKFKPLLRTEFKFINDGKFLKLIRDQAGIEATKTYAEVKKEFEENIKRLAENNPIIIETNARIKAGIERERLQNSQLASGLGLKIPGINETESALTNIQRESIIAANNISAVLTPAFQSLFSSIKAGENPLKAFFDSIGQAIEQLIQKLIAAVVQALILSAIFPGGVGGVKGFGGFFKNVLGFASGGVVTGPTLALIGEGRGTSSTNPEIVAPLDKLRGMLAGIGSSQPQIIVVNGRTRGNQFQLLANRTTRQNGRLGAR